MEYDVDALSKATLATQSAQSPLLYACMGRSNTQRSPHARATACSRSIGPGAYTFPVPQDMRVSLVLKQGPLSRCVCLQDAPLQSERDSVLPQGASVSLATVIQLSSRQVAHTVAQTILECAFEHGGAQRLPGRPCELHSACSMASGASRLATDKADPTKNLGSTWRPDHDLVHWKRGVTISKAAYKRPSYLPRA